MNVNDFLSIGAIIISGISLFLTYKNKKEQQELEKEIQQNEFNFSRRKIWFEKQNEVIERSIEKIIDMHQITGEIITYAELKESLLNNQEGKVSREIQERVEDIIINSKYLISHKYYFSINMEKNVDMVLQLSNEISAQLNEKVKNNKKNNVTEIKKIRTDLDKMSTHIREIIKEVREEHLNL